jgi:tetratricopeptide (TPR) repeat protein
MEARGIPWRTLAPLALVAAVIAVYAASLRGGFLNYDDDWLIQNNPVLQRGGGLGAIWFDLGAQTRHQLGAEYLPVRDTLMWLEVRLLGLSPQGMRAVSLLLYLAAVLVMRAYLRATFSDETLAELVTVLFALHPVHVESVAWLAGQKDLCVLLLGSAALLAHARDRPSRVVPLVLLAVLSKSVAVVLPALFLLHEWFVGRRRLHGIVVTAVLAGGALLLHLHVGRTVGMLADWPGGSRVATAATMGPVWLRYLGLCFAPVGLSIRHEVPVHGAGDLAAWAAYLPLGLLAVAAAAAARRGHPLAAFALAWFVLPMLPTSQVLAPLQNRMADRYLLLSVLGPCLLLGAIGRHLPGRSGVVAVLAVAALFAGLSAARARVFTSSVALWQDAVAHEPASARAQYQYAMALRDARRPADYESALRRALESAGSNGDDPEVGRRAANNLSSLLAGSGRLREAQAVLKEAVARFPDDPKALGNLAEITARLGEREESRRLFERLLQRFADYQPGRRNFLRHFPPATPAPAPTPTPTPPPPPTGGPAGSPPP